MSFKQLIKEKLPNHIAIIMDGNGRWANKRSFKRIFGHREGMESVKEIVRACRELDIKALTLYAFSSQNWQRPELEVKALMGLLKKYVRSEVNELNENNVRLQGIGELSKLPKSVIKVFNEAVEITKNNTGMVLSVALSYGGREEILNAVLKIANKIKTGELSSADLTEVTISENLYTAGLPDPDLLIRTSGELRVSNFLLWQIAYSEIYVTDVLWPDFRKDDLYRALIEFQNRKRRFGLTDEQISAG
jgi:undecaprenyl diphosphate synthase